jgi:hypothetical protein
MGRALNGKRGEAARRGRAIISFAAKRIGYIREASVVTKSLFL